MPASEATRYRGYWSATPNKIASVYLSNPDSISIEARAHYWAERIAEEVEDYPAQLTRANKHLGITTRRPAKVTVAIDDATGEMFFGTSGTPYITQIHPKMNARMFFESLEKWPIPSCAEFKACNFALWAGYDIPNLTLYTIDVPKFMPAVRCANCQIITQGANVPSDLLRR